MNEAVLQLQQIRKQHRSGFLLAVDRLEIRPAERFCVLGPTGAGKSTLLRLAAGIDPPDSGTVTMRGVRVHGPEADPKIRRSITMVFQNPLMLDRTVEANIRYPARLRGGPKVAVRSAEWLRRLGLEPLARRRPATLSGGQVQLVAIARALAAQPQVLVLDEPTAHLDPAHVALVEQVICQAQQERAMAVIWATHNLFQARRVSHRVALALSGRLVEVAETSQFFECPADSRSADFVQGKMIY